MTSTIIVLSISITLFTLLIANEVSEYRASKRAKAAEQEETLSKIKNDIHELNKRTTLLEDVTRYYGHLK